MKFTTKIGSLRVTISGPKPRKCAAPIPRKPKGGLSNG